MARRKINSVEDFVELTAQVPWWVGVAAALVSWIALSDRRPVGVGRSGR